MCINGRMYVCCGECYVVSDECDELTSCLVQPIVAHCCEVMYIGCIDFRGELGFLNCDDICMCVVNKQFELLEFVFESVYVNLQYEEIYLTFTAGSVRLCGVCSPVVVLCLSAVSTRGSGVLSSACDVLEMSVVMECVTCVCVGLRSGWEVLGRQDWILGFTNSGRTWGKWDM